MRRLGFAAAALFLFAGVARAEIVVTISKADQQMAVAINGTPAYHWTVSTGREGYNTPVGSFRATRLERVYYSLKYDNAPMPNSVFFHHGYAIHGTYEVNKLGRPASRGCVRLAPANAATLFALVRAHGMSNTRVVITDGPLRGETMASWGPRRYQPPRQAGLAVRQYDSARSFDLGRRERRYEAPRYEKRRGIIVYQPPPRRSGGWREGSFEGVFR